MWTHSQERCQRIALYKQRNAVQWVVRSLHRRRGVCASLPRDSRDFAIWKLSIVLWDRYTARIAALTRIIGDE